jgi:hypothetical protein
VSVGPPAVCLPRRRTRLCRWSARCACSTAPCCCCVAWAACRASQSQVSLRWRPCYGAHTTQRPGQGVRGRRPGRPRASPWLPACVGRALGRGARPAMGCALGCGARRPRCGRGPARRAPACLPAVRCGVACSGPPDAPLRRAARRVCEQARPRGRQPLARDPAGARQAQAQRSSGAGACARARARVCVCCGDEERGTGECWRAASAWRCVLGRWQPHGVDRCAHKAACRSSTPRCQHSPSAPSPGLALLLWLCARRCPLGWRSSTRASWTWCGGARCALRAQRAWRCVCLVCCVLACVWLFRAACDAAQGSHHSTPLVHARVPALTHTHTHTVRCRACCSVRVLLLPSTPDE